MEIRIALAGNPNAGKIMENLKWFADNEIPFHTQIVLCPDYNDGDELNRTLKELTSLGEALLSIAIVPVGITQFRDKKLKTVDKECAINTIEIAKKYPKACCSDEFFLLAGMEIPSSEYYGNFSQLDDGVGSLRSIMDDFDELEKPKKLKEPVTICFACSVAAKSAFEYISKELNKIENLRTIVNPVESTYWGENITVAGLITSDDLINSIKDVEADYIIVPAIMLKPYTDLFLDGVSMKEVIKKTGKNIFITQNNYSVCEVIDLLYDYQ